MITIRCTTPDTASLVDLRQFQGELKKRTSTDIEALITSIKEDGLLMPFVVWEGNKLLDGHARMEAITRMAIDDPALLEQELPLLRIEAEDEDEAKRILLQITSSYGRITTKGLAKFTASIVNYKNPAPVVLKAIKAVTPKVVAAPVVDDTVVLLKLSVKKDIVGRLKEILKTVDGVEFL